MLDELGEFIIGAAIVTVVVITIKTGQGLKKLYFSSKAALDHWLRDEYKAGSTTIESITFNTEKGDVVIEQPEQEPRPVPYNTENLEDCESVNCGPEDDGTQCKDTYDGTTLICTCTYGTYDNEGEDETDWFFKCGVAG